MTKKNITIKIIPNKSRKIFSYNIVLRFSMLALLIIFLPQFLFSQHAYTYFEHYYEARKEQYLKNNNKALEEYSKAFKTKLGDVTHYMDALYLAFECKDTSSIKTIIEYGALRGLTKSDIKVVYNHYYKQNPDDYIALAKELILLGGRGNEINENKQLKREINRLVRKDQRVHTKKPTPKILAKTQIVDSLTAIELASGVNIDT